MYSSRDALRQAMLKIRNSLPLEILDKMSDVIQMKITGMSEFAEAITVAAYHSIGSEVRTSKISNRVLQMNKRLAIPKVIDETSMIFALVKDLNEDLHVGKYNIMAPKDHCELLEKVDLVLIPGIVWDVSGHRLGYGQGYYDRFLSKLQPTSIGLAYDFQVVEEIPPVTNDFCVNMIVTDKRTIDCM
ncbi:MAG: 5-formyltetrahydrofolate cyclo-ligase [Nitrososphaerales archaeon]